MSKEIKRSKEMISVWAKKIIIAFFGVAFIGFAIAFNASAFMGNDPLSVFFDGVRAVMYQLTGINNLGLATNIVNYTLMVIIFLIARKYINIGTFIYTLPLGSFVQLGFKIFGALHIPTDVIGWQIFSFLLGCFMLFLGIAIFIAVDIGLDPWTALTMFIGEKIHKSFRIVKVCLDITTLVIGFFMGGRFGPATIFAAIAGGPSIQKFSEILDRTLLKALKINKPKTSDINGQEMRKDKESN